MTDSTSSSPTPVSADAVCGRRQIMTQNQTGQPRYETLPLVADDFLNPQPGDEFFHGEPHDQAVRRLVRSFRHLYRYSSLVTVLSGVKLLWPGSGLSQPAPDLMLVADLPSPDQHRTTLDLAREGGDLRLVLEVTSPKLAEIDRIQKQAVYAHAGVPEYVIVDPGTQDPFRPGNVDVLTLENGEYHGVMPDPSGRLHSKVAKIWWAVRPDGDLEIVEARTGRPIEPPTEDEEPVAAAQSEAELRAQSIASKLDFLR